MLAGKFRTHEFVIEPARLIVRDGLRVPLGVDKKAFIIVSDFWISENPGSGAMAIIPEERQFITAEALPLAFLTDPNSNAVYVHVENEFTFSVYDDLAAKIATGQPLPLVVERLRLAVASVTPTSTTPDAHQIPQDGNQQAATSVDPDISNSISPNRKLTKAPDHLNTVNPTAAVDPASIPRTTLDDLFADHFHSQLPVECNLHDYDPNDPNDPNSPGLPGGGDDGNYIHTSALPWSEDEALGTEKNSPSVDNNNITLAMANWEDTGGVNFGSNKIVEKK